MRSLAIFLLTFSALAISLPAAAQDAPSNAALFRMLKAQQLTLAKQAAMIGELRAELRKSHAALKRTQHDVKRGSRQVLKLTARVEQASSAVGGGKAGHDAFAARTEPNSFSVESSYLSLAPSLNDTYFASVGTTSGSPDGTLYTNDPGYKAAFRIGATYTNGFTGRKLMAFYTQLFDSSIQQFSGSNLWAARGSADLLANFENYTGTATSEIDLKYRRFDVLMSEPVNWGDSDLNFLYGIEYAHMKWDETETYVRTVTGTSTSSAKFNGVGPQIGFSLSYRPFARLNPAAGGLSLDTTATGSLLLANSSSSLFDVYHGTSIGRVQTDSTKRIIAALHARVGLGYAFGWDRFSATVKGGYEYNSYINGLQRLGNHDDVADGQYTVKYNNFDLSGFYATFKLKAAL